METASRLPERIALDVEDHVAGRGPGQALEATSGLRDQRVPADNSVDTPAQLQPGLIVKGVERARRELGRVRRRPRELLEGMDTRRPQAVDLLAPDPGHQAQVVFPRPLLVAHLAELAKRAV